MARRKQKEFDYAKMLYVNQRLTKKEVAARVGVTEKTLGKWVDHEKWDNLRKSMLVTKDTQLTNLYNQLEWINNHISERDVIYDLPAGVHPTDKDFNPAKYRVVQGNVANSKEADAISKITGAIQKLETETSMGDTIEVAMKFIDFVRADNFELSKKITDYFDAYINTLVK